MYVEDFTRLGNGALFVRRAGHHPEPKRGPTHVNGGIELSWVERGTIAFELPKQTIEAGAGGCIVLPSDLENTPCSRSVCVHQLILPDPMVDAGPSTWAAAKQLRRPHSLAADHAVTALMRLVAADLRDGASSDDPALLALIEALICRLSDAPSPRAPRGDVRVRRALALIEDAFAEPLTVERLAEAAGMSPFAFSRAFRAQVGQSPYQYLLEIRLVRAAEQLRSGDDTVLAVALACGFGDPSRFARAFRLRFGVTPRSYRSAAG